MENEAKKSLEFLISGKSDQYPPDYDLQIQVAIKALEEVEKYRNIGVVSADELEQDLLLYKADREILSEYQKLGTVEELKIAKEKQIAKKVKIQQWIYTKCDCGYEFSKHHGDGYYSIPLEKKTNYCPKCGQKLDWSDTD